MIENGVRSLSRLAVVAMMVGWASTGLPAGAADDVIDFESERWNRAGGRIVEHLGRKALTGTAILEDVEFEDGIIEVDLAITGARGYPGFLFRRQSRENAERFYLRTHRANGSFQDALQYTPVIGGIAGWQLYNGDGFTSAVDVPVDTWIPLRLEIRGSRARAFVGGSEAPALDIPRLQHGVSRGAIGVMAEPAGAAFFSNFRYRAEGVPELPPAPPERTPYGVVTEWDLSRPFASTEIDPERSPASQGLTDLGWRRVASLPSGLVDVARHVRWAPGRAEWVWARTVLRAEAPEVRPFRFGYSDVVTVFLNGRPVFSGDSAYRSRDSAFSGIVGLHDTVYLPLVEGDNEVLLLVGESFGGWGFVGRDAAAVYRHGGLREAWTLSRTLHYPESVVYDGRREVLYVSNFFHGGDEYLSRVDLDGKVRDLRWIEGLDRPTGMHLAGDRLFAVTRSALVEIDVERGEIVARHAFPAPGFANDVTGDAAGEELFVTDSRRNAVLRFHEGAFEIWLEGNEVAQPNGILLDGDRLLVGSSADGCVKRIDRSDRSIADLVCLGESSTVDGLRPDGRGGYVVSDYNGRAFRVDRDGAATLLLDTTAPETRCADLEYVPDLGLLIVPTLESQRLTAYRLEEGLR